jgi:hypothetical protein
MGIRLGRVVVGALLGAIAITAGASPATAASGSRDQQLAKTGVLVAADLPTDFTAKPAGTASDAEVAKLAKGISSCDAYVSLRKLTSAQPQAKSQSFEDASRQVSNEVDVFKSAAAASSALALYDKSSVPKCLQALYAKVLTGQFAKQASTKGKIASVKVTITQTPISGVGDASVVYEGHAVVTGKDGSTVQVGIGNAAVQVGPAVSDYSYTTTDADLATVLQPAIDSSLARLTAAVATAS